jgi:hypothetical protein
MGFRDKAPGSFVFTSTEVLATTTTEEERIARITQ